MGQRLLNFNLEFINVSNVSGCTPGTYEQEKKHDNGNSEVPKKFIQNLNNNMLLFDERVSLLIKHLLFGNQQEYSAKNEKLSVRCHVPTP